MSTPLECKLCHQRRDEDTIKLANSELSKASRRFDPAPPQRYSSRSSPSYDDRLDLSSLTITS